MRVLEIAVACEKRVSDGNYGGENARIELRAALETDDHLETCIDILQHQARERVLADLDRSLSGFVRLAVADKKVTEPEPTPFDDIEVPL